MRVFHCDHCGQAVFFENVVCERCGHRLAYLPDLKIVASLDPVGPPADDPALQRWTSPARRAAGRQYRLCENYLRHRVCNWARPADEPGVLCLNCRLTRVIPDLSDPKNEDAWRRLEVAKRRLVYSLTELRLPVRDRLEEPERGLEFRFLADPPSGPRVLTGHASGVITMNIVEADDVERERMRVSMHEPYRTILGHFRHEVGHYYWDLLVRDAPRIDAFRAMFGDERDDYAAALQRHYDNGPAADWRSRFVSAYAGVHPWEDWAETWAHYLHMTDALETAAACGLALHPPRPDEPAMAPPPPKPAHEQSFGEIVTNWFPLTYVLNSLNRGMGLPDAYPFVLPTPAIDKLRFVHETICGAVRRAGERESPSNPGHQAPAQEGVTDGSRAVAAPQGKLD